MSITLSIPCEGTLLPTKAALTNIFVQIANLPSVLRVEIEKLRREAVLQIEEEARQRILQKIAPLEEAIIKANKILDKLEKIFGKNFPVSVSNPVYKGVSIPDKEWERRITALTQEFHLYVQAKLIEIISSVIPLSFDIPVLGLSIDVVQLFSNAAYRAELKAQIIEQVDTLFGILPEPYRLYDGKRYGVNSKAIRAEIVSSYIMARLQNAATKIIYDALGKLIDKFNTIWETLGLPPLPALLSMDVGALIEAKIASLIQEVENAPTTIKNEIRKKIIREIESIEIFGFRLVDIIGGEVYDNVLSFEENMHRYIEGLQNFAEQWVMYLLKKYMEKINKFLKLIGLGALFEWFTFDFCKFLKLVGIPTSITLDVGIDLTKITTRITLENNYVDPYPEIEGELPDS